MKLALAILLVAAACASERVSPGGFKGVRIGMTAAEASKAYGSPLEPASELFEDELSCLGRGPGRAGSSLQDGHRHDGAAQ